MDDPTRDTFEGIPLLGSYPVDDDGVPAAPVTLVDGGQLKAFYISRIPTKEIEASNGHSRRGPGGRITGQPANVLVTAEEGVADLKERLRALCKEEGLAYGLLVERFKAGGGAGRRGGGRFNRGRFGGGGTGAQRRRGGAVDTRHLGALVRAGIRR